MPALRTFILGCLLGVAAAVVSLLLSWLGAFDRIEGMTYDMRVRALAPRVDVPVKIIVLDQGSLAAGAEQKWSWPWNRSLYAYVVRYFNKAQVKSLAVDVVFTEPSDDPPADHEFADAVKAMPNFIGALLTSTKGGPMVQWKSGSLASPFKMEGGKEWLAKHPENTLHAMSATFPYAELAAATKMYGHVRGEIEGDSIVRRVVPVQEFDGQAVPRLGIAAWLLGTHVDAKNSTGSMPTIKLEGSTLHLGDRIWQLDEQGAALLHYYRPREGSAYAFEVFPVADIIASQIVLEENEANGTNDKPKIPREVFKDCHVIFGFTAAALYDLKPTPFNPTMPGVELHATTIANLIRGDSMSFAPRSATTFFVLLWSALIGAVTVRGGQWWQLLTTALLALALPILIGVFAYRSGIWWPIILPLIASAFSLAAGIVYIYTFENRQRRFIRAAFSRYLSDEVIERLVNDPTQLKLGGQERELSIFFSDIEGFSSISERLQPTATTALLNEVLSVVSQIILDEGGTLDKYMGDGVVAFWNAPTDQPDHAVRAVRAAIRCQRRLTELEEHFKTLAGGHPVRTRIGINTGRVLVGNLGSHERFDYSVLGDAANLASRLEGANKAFGTHILVSLETWSRTQGNFHGRVLGRVMVVGRETPVQIVEPLCFANEPMPAKAAMVAQVIAMCGEGRAEQAIAQLEALAEDPVAAALTKYLKTLDPKQSLDGVWRLTSK